MERLGVKEKPVVYDQADQHIDWRSIGGGVFGKKGQLSPLYVYYPFPLSLFFLSCVSVFSLWRGRRIPLSIQYPFGVLLYTERETDIPHSNKLWLHCCRKRGLTSRRMNSSYQSLSLSAPTVEGKNNILVR